MSDKDNRYQRVIITKFGDPQVLEVVEDVLRAPKHGEVRVRVLATSACFTDTMIRKGIYPDVKKMPPFSPGYDVVGVIDAVGPGIAELQKGQKVAALTVTGAYSEYIYLDNNDCVPIPETIDPSEAVSLVLSYVTAYQMLHRIGKVKNGDRILVHGASGAVGTALIQIGKLLDLEMYGTASTENQEYVKELGAIPIDYKKQDFVEKMASLEPPGVDVVFDAIAGDNFKRSFNCLRKGGTVVAYGTFNASIGKQSQFSSMMSCLGLLLRGWLPNNKHSKIYSIAVLKKKYPSWFKEDLSVLLSMLENKQIKPVISETFSLLDARDAHILLESRGVKGKIVLHTKNMST